MKFDDLCICECAKYRKIPPEQLNFKDEASWLAWKKRFTRYILVSALDEKDDAEKIDTLIYIMGEKSADIFAQFQPVPETYDATLQSFED